MKKLKCEVCGSIDIKKVSEDIFECQSCGVQYSTSDVKKLLVEIDHTNEVKNYIKRGEHFEDEGDSEKAREYYNKALDLDAENASAQEGIDRIDEQQELEDFYIIEADIKPEENLKDFFKQLATTKNIACDIYKNIVINSVVEKYIPAIFVKYKCEYNWSATACNRYYENQTVYKERYNSDLKRYVKEPVTEKVERIARTPVSGNSVYDHDGFALASNSARNDCHKQGDLLEELLSEFETLQDDKYSEYSPVALNHSKIVQTAEAKTYNGLLLDLEIDYSVCEKKKREILDSGDSKASSYIHNGISADFVENYHCVRSVLSDSVATILVPVQIINYTYKGQKFTAISDLLSKTSSMPMIYPCDTDLSEKKESLNQEKAKANSNSGLATFGWILFIGGLIIWLIGGTAESGGIMAFGIIAWVVSYFLLIPSFIIKSKQKKQFEDNSNRYKIELFYPRKKYLSRSYDLFFEKYTGLDSLEAIKSSIPENDITIAIHSQVAFSGEISDFSSLSDSDIQTDTDKTIENVNRLSEAKKKRIMPICLMVGGWLVMMIGVVLAAAETAEVLGIISMLGGFACLAIIGPIMLGKVNKEILAIRNELKKTNESWINE